MTTTTTHTIETLRAAVKTASEAWTGLDWDSNLPDPERIREGGRVSSDGVSSYGHSDGSLASEEHQGRVRELRRLLDLIADGDDDLREEAAALAEELIEEEDAAVTADADRATEEGHAAIASAEAGDWIFAALHARHACSIERNYGDAPAWGPVLRMVEALRDAADAAEGETYDRLLAAGKESIRAAESE